MSAQSVPTTHKLVSNDTLHNRLVTREGGGAKSSARGTLAKCTLKYRDFTQLVTSSSPPSEEELQEAMGALRRELLVHKLEMKKLVVVSESAEAELVEYDTSQRDIERSIANSRRDIEALRARLVQEKRVRRDKEEYEALARIANELPSKRATKRKLSDVRTQMDVILGEDLRTAKELEVREKQFQLLLQCIFDLKSNLAEDQEEKDLSQRGGMKVEDENNDATVDELKPKRGKIGATVAINTTNVL